MRGAFFRNMRKIHRILSALLYIGIVLPNLRILLFQLEIVEGCKVPVKLKLTGDWREYFVLAS